MSRGSSHGKNGVLLWPAVCLATGAPLGILVGVLDAVVAQRVAAHERPSLAQLIGAGSVSLIEAALVSFLIGALTAPFLRWRAGRVAAVVLTGTFAGLFTTAHLVSGVVRALAGSYLTLGAVEFFFAGGSHLVWTIVTGYGRWVLLLAVVFAFVTYAAGRVARAALSRTYETARVPLVWIIAPTCLATSGFLPASTTKNLAAASPEAAFLESLAPEEPEPPTPETLTGNAADVPKREPKEGPEQLEGPRWQVTVREMKPRSTNVLLLTLESISLHHLGYSGYERPTTPNLDRIAARSLRMRRAWTTATHSNYAQMAILSSLFPRRTTGLDVYKRLDYPRVLLHDVFHTLGYATATISSQDESWQGMIKFQETGTPTFYRHSKHYTSMRQDIGSELVVMDHVTAEVASDWVRRQGSRPWALYVNFQGTHFPYKLQSGIPTPFQPTAVTPGGFSYLSYPESDRQAVVNRYDNALRYVDEQIGRLYRSLEAQGKLDDTIWVITADHGENFHDHGQVTHGRTLYDTEARVPLLIHWPKGLEPGDVDEPASHLDILPTILDLLELPPHPAHQGRSLRAAADPTTEPTGIYLNIQGLKSAEALICFPWKYVVNRSDKTTELFQLEQDPDEREDRSARYPEIAEALRVTLSQQVAAQLSYHRKDNPALHERYAPRLLTCPNLPEVERAQAPNAPRVEQRASDGNELAPSPQGQRANERQN
ncbi:MAG: sulfatase-like hydrolase/transferase [Polyangiaceae bacterium]